MYMHYAPESVHWNTGKHALKRRAVCTDSSVFTAIATDARKVGINDENPAKCYLETKELEYEYFEVLKTYVPMMLEKQEFFKSAFQ